MRSRIDRLSKRKVPNTLLLFGKERRVPAAGVYQYLRDDSPGDSNKNSGSLDVH